MPTYEYECQECGRHFDAFQRMSAEPYKTCPEELCQITPWGKGKVKRLLGAGAGLIFKGSGFYITDYRSEGYKSSAKQESGTASNASSETKPSSTAKNEAPKKSEAPTTTSVKASPEKKK